MPAQDKEYDAITSGNQVKKIMKKYDIKKSVIWHISQYISSPSAGNKIVNDIIKNEPELFGCWTVLPPQTDQIIDNDFYNKMKQNNIVFLRVFPENHNFLLNSTVFAEFFAEISTRKIPLVLSLEKGVSWPDVYRLMEEYPELTCILTDIGIWGVDRYTWPLLEKYPDVYLETSLLSLEAGGIEAAVGKYSADRLIFGSGFPERYIEASRLALIRAEISEKDKEKIACKNLENLISRINVN